MNDNYTLKIEKILKHLRKLHLIVISKPKKEVSNLIMQYSHLCMLNKDFVILAN